MGNRTGRIIGMACWLALAMAGGVWALDIDLDNNNATDIEFGGTNAKDAAGARTNLGCQPINEMLTDLSALQSERPLQGSFIIPMIGATSFGYANTYESLGDFLGSGDPEYITGGTPWRIYYTASNGALYPLAFGTSGQVLISQGATSAPTWGNAGSGDITSVLGVSSGAVPQLYQAPASFSDGDTTPDVSAGTVFRTVNSSPTTITDFDAGVGSLNNGQILIVIVQDSNTTFDFTSSGLEGTASDYKAANGEVLMFVYDTSDTQWHYLGFPKTVSGITLSNIPYDIAWSWAAPVEADIQIIRLQRAVSLTSLGCIVDPEGTGESVVLAVSECDSNGDNCASILGSTLTCGNTPTTASISDSSLAANAFIKLTLGTVTGTVKTLSIYGVGTQSY